jgi:arsenate reductase (thioredoxin)
VLRKGCCARRRRPNLVDIPDVGHDVLLEHPERCSGCEADPNVSQMSGARGMEAARMELRGKEALMRHWQIAVGVAVLGIASLSWTVVRAQHASAPRREKTTVIFVCEHGAAQSVIAAAYFNRLAAERHLPYRAIARGASPQENPSVATAAGLKADNMPVSGENPKGLSDAEAANAVRIVAFCSIPDKFARIAPIEKYEDVPLVADGYAASRDKIVHYVKQVLDELERTRK